jgi:hypothetical protein
LILIFFLSDTFILLLLTFISPTREQEKNKVRTSRSKSVERQMTQKIEKSSNEIRKAITGSDSSGMGSSLPLLASNTRATSKSPHRQQKKLKVYSFNAS